MAEAKTPKPDPEKDLPAWAMWLRRQLNGVNLVIGGIAIVVATGWAFYANFPSFTSKLDCTKPNLTKAEWKKCLK